MGRGEGSVRGGWARTKGEDPVERTESLQKKVEWGRKRTKGKEEHGGKGKKCTGKAALSKKGRNV